MQNVSYPQVIFRKDQKVYVSFYIRNKRFRLFNGTRLNIPLRPNDFPIDQRLAQGYILAAEVYKKLIAGEEPKKRGSTTFNSAQSISDRQYFQLALEHKLNQNHSEKHQKYLQYAYNKMNSAFESDQLNTKLLQNILNEYTNNTSYNTIRRYMLNLSNEAQKQGMNYNPLASIKPRKAKAQLNKPFRDIGKILNEINAFNSNLHLCCLITYGCLLRPHREIRELKWSDFSSDLSFIKLSGERNKTGVNRIVPVPKYVKEHLVKGEEQHNIFSQKINPPNPDYFKALWKRYKRTSEHLEDDQTLYSFRHSGAIEIYKRTESIEKLKSAMGHSSILSTLTYLRGLEVSKLKEEDMPMINSKY